MAGIRPRKGFFDESFPRRSVMAGGQNLLDKVRMSGTSPNCEHFIPAFLMSIPPTLVAVERPDLNTFPMQCKGAIHQACMLLISTCI